MIRLILRRDDANFNVGTQTPYTIYQTPYTIDVECPELETALQRGGFGEEGFERHTLIGVELIKPPTES